MNSIYHHTLPSLDQIESPFQTKKIFKQHKSVVNRDNYFYFPSFLQKFKQKQEETSTKNKKSATSIKINQQHKHDITSHSHNITHPSTHLLLLPLWTRKKYQPDPYSLRLVDGAKDFKWQMRESTSNCRSDNRFIELDRARDLVVSELKILDANSRSTKKLSPNSSQSLVLKMHGLQEGCTSWLISGTYCLERVCNWGIMF